MAFACSHLRRESPSRHYFVIMTSNKRRRKVREKTMRWIPRRNLGAPTNPNNSPKCTYFTKNVSNNGSKKRSSVLCVVHLLKIVFAA